MINWFTHSNFRILRMLFAALAALGFTLASGAGEFNRVISIGDPMPSFNALPGVDGNTLSASDLKTDLVVLVSLANHCPWVRGMDGDLVKLVAANQGKSVTVVGFSVNHREDDRLDAMKEHAQKTGYKFAYVFDESQDLGRALGAAYTPEYFVFDKDRKLAYSGALYNSPARMTRDGLIRHTKGAPTRFYVQEAIDALLGGKRPVTSETKAHGCSVKYITG